MDAIHNACLFVAGAFSRRHRADHSLRRVHPLRAQQRGIVAGAVGDLVDDRGLVSLRRGVLSRVSAHRRRRFCPRFCTNRPKSYLGWILEVLMLTTNLFMLVWGIKLCQATLAPGHPGISRRYRRPFLSADPDRRRAHRLVRDRALHDAESSSSEPEPETVSQLTTE